MTKIDGNFHVKRQEFAFQQTALLKQSPKPFDSLQSAKKEKKDDFGTQVLNAIKNAWEYCYYGVKAVIEFFFCRCWMEDAEEEFDWEQPPNLFYLHPKKREKIFDTYPSDFKNKVFAYFNKISKKEIHSFQDLSKHPFFERGFQKLFEKFFSKTYLDLYKEALENLDSPEKNKEVFQELPYLFQRSYVSVKNIQKESVDEKLREVIRNPKTYLTKEGLQGVLESQIKHLDVRIQKCKVELNEQLAKEDSSNEQGE